MKLTSENEVKSALGVTGLEHLDRAGLQDFLALVPEMEAELAKGLLTSPTLQTLLGDMLTTASEDYKGTLAANDSGQEKFQERWLKEFQLYTDRLEKSELSETELAAILDGLSRLSEQSASAEVENKKFLSGLFEKQTIGKMLTVVGVIGVFVAVAAKASGNNGLSK